MKMKSAATRTYVQSTRARAAEATGRRIVDAFLARLMRQWYDEITLDQVAKDADVTVQTVIRRFGGKDGLLAAAVPVFADQINRRRAGPPNDVDHLAARLVGDFERIGDAVIRLLALEGRHPALHKALDIGRREHRKWVASMFGAVLERGDPTSRRTALDALVIVTDVYTWKLLRRDMGHGVATTRAIMRQAIAAIIEGFC